MGKWWAELLRKWLYFLILGILWLFWQLLTDELAEIVREHISEGGLIMYGVTHPYIIMPSLLILFSLYALLRSREKVKEGDKTRKARIKQGEELYSAICRFLERDRLLAEETVKRIPKQELEEFRRHTKETDIMVFLKDKEGYPPMLGELRQNDKEYFDLKEATYRLNKEFGDKKLSKNILLWIRMELARNTDLAWGRIFMIITEALGSIHLNFYTWQTLELKSNALRLKIA